MKFLNGIYGLDLLSLSIMLLSSILSMFPFVNILSLPLSIFALYRVFSRNIYRRQEEFNMFINYVNKILARFGRSLPYNIRPYKFESLSYVFNKLNKDFSQRKIFKITKCPRCKQKLRLPRGKGKIVVSCKKCGNKFDFKT